MLIHAGTQERVITEVTRGSGTTSREGSIASDSLIATLWVNSVSSGNLSITINTLTDNGKELALFSFPTVSAGSTNLLLKKSGVSLQRFRIIATYTGICSYEVYIRAIAGLGESETKIIGANTLRVTQTTITTTPALVVSPAMTDRHGIIIRNWNASGGSNLYIGPDSGVTSGSSYPIAGQETLAIDLEAGQEIWGVASSGTVDARIAEAGG